MDKWFDQDISVLALMAAILHGAWLQSPLLVSKTVSVLHYHV